VFVDDKATWERAAAAAISGYSAMPSGDRVELDRLLEEIMALKQKLVELVTAAGSTAVCRSCGGECCLLGKYHISVLDILAYHVTGVTPLTPDFSSHPACPYSGGNGCLMPPGFRPVTCVIFNCQMLEGRLTQADRETVHGYESRLRTAVNRAGRISSTRIDRPLLLSCS
jgi:hypothetical protein